MKIYGIAILSLCYLTGQVLGDILGRVFGFQGNMGGVAFGMLLLIFWGDYFKKNRLISKESESGILFWTSMYIPVVVAMSATQNVKAAWSGGWTALVVGVASTIFCFFLIPLVSNLSNSEEIEN
jgi:malonate transporter MadL subunit